MIIVLCMLLWSITLHNVGCRREEERHSWQIGNEEDHVSFPNVLLYILKSAASETWNKFKLENMNRKKLISDHLEQCQGKCWFITFNKQPLVT